MVSVEERLNDIEKRLDWLTLNIATTNECIELNVKNIFEHMDWITQRLDEIEKSIISKIIVNKSLTSNKCHLCNGSGKNIIDINKPRLS